MRPARWGRAVLAAMALQAGLFAAFWFVESGRQVSAPFAVEALDEPAPALRLARDGVPVTVPGTPHLVHFWATWCAPCVVELPGLIAASASEGVPLVAVTDEPWDVVVRFFDGDVPSAVVQDVAGDGAKRWAVSGLPDTFVVRDGRIVGRMGGPRAWETVEASRFLQSMGSR